MRNACEDLDHFYADFRVLITVTLSHSFAYIDNFGHFVIVLLNSFDLQDLDLTSYDFPLTDFHDIGYTLVVILTPSELLLLWMDWAIVCLLTST